MNKWLKIGGIVSLVVLVGLMAWSAVAFAQESMGTDYFREFRGGPSFGRGGFGGPMGEDFMAGHGEGFSRGGPGHGRELGGEVTTVGDSSFTILTRNDESVVVNVSDETKVMLAETQSEGSLSDIEAGDTVGVRGPKNDDGTVDTLGIIVMPRGDRAGGKVTAVNGETISVENPRDGEVTIITNADTQFRLGREEGSLADVTEDKFVGAFGETQDDGSLVARLVMVREPGTRGPGGPGGPRQGFQGGEVAAIDGTTFTLNTFRGGEVTVLTDDSTQYHIRSGAEVSFADIEVGGKVGVAGDPVDGQENTIQAKMVDIMMK